MTWLWVPLKLKLKLWCQESLNYFFREGVGTNLYIDLYISRTRRQDRVRGRPTSVFRSILIIIANADYANYPFVGLFVSSSTDM